MPPAPCLRACVANVPPPPPCRAFLEERLARDGAFSDSLDSDTAELRRLLGLGNKEAAQIEAEVKTSTYK